MSQLDNLSFGKSHTQDSFSDKLSREGSLLAGAPDSAWSGLKARAEDSWEHKLETGAEVVGSFALGAGLSMALKNPELAAAARFVPWIAAGLVASDAAKRLGAPIVETWNDANSLARNKVRLGANVGAMAFDYTLMGTAGAAGAHFGPGLAGRLMGASAATEASGSAVGSAVDPLKFKPSAISGGPQIGDTPLTRADLADLMKTPNMRLDPALLNAKFNGDWSNVGVLTTTKTVGLPLGTDMGMAVAAGSDMARPRHDTNLGALTEISPFKANFNEAVKGFQLESGEMIKKLDIERSTFQSKSKEWLKSLDKQ